MRSPALLIHNRMHPHAIGDSIAAVPMAWRLAKEGLISSVIWSCPLMPGVWDLGIPQFHWEDPELANLGGRPWDFEVQQVVGAWLGKEPRGLPGYFWRAAGLSGEVEGWPGLLGKAGSPGVLHSNGIILLAPHSHSDHGTGTKVWPEAKWEALIAGLEEYEIGILSGPSDPEFRPDRPDFWGFSGLSIPTLADLMWDASVTITVDNGMGWLAQALSVPHIQILSSNMPREYAWDPGLKVINMSHSSSTEEVLAAMKNLLNLLKLREILP